MTTAESYSQILDYLRGIRRKENIKQDLVALRMGVPVAQVSALETHKKIPSMEQISAYAKAIGFTLSSTILLPGKITGFTIRDLPDDIAVGEKYGKWTVCGLARMDSSSHTFVLCCCECEDHTLSFVDKNKLKDGKTTSCGCDRRDKIAQAMKDKAPNGPEEDLRGKTFNDLLILDDPPRKNAQDKWEWHTRCLRDGCGAEKWYVHSKIVRGEVKTCGKHKRGRVSRVPENMAGMKFGFLTVLSGRKIVNGNIMVEARCHGCDKNKPKFYRATHLLDHNTLSCGCGPKLTEGMLVGKYKPTIQKRNNRKGLPEYFCFNEATCKYEWVLKEKLYRIILGQRKKKESLW